MTVGEKVADLRKKENLSQKEFANKIEVATGTVAEWESNETIPTITDLTKICEKFSISGDYFIKNDTTLNSQIEDKKDKNGSAQPPSKKPSRKTITYFAISILVLILIVLVSCIAFSPRITAIKNFKTEIQTISIKN